MNPDQPSSLLLKDDTLALLLTALFFAYISANVVGAILLLCTLAYLLVSVVASALRSTDRYERLVSVLHLTIIAVIISCTDGDVHDPAGPGNPF